MCASYSNCMQQQHAPLKVPRAHGGEALLTRRRCSGRAPAPRAPHRAALVQVRRVARIARTGFACLCVFCEMVRGDTVWVRCVWCARRAAMKAAGYSALCMYKKHPARSATQTHTSGAGRQQTCAGTHVRRNASCQQRGSHRGSHPPEHTRIHRINEKYKKVCLCVYAWRRLCHGLRRRRTITTTAAAATATATGLWDTPNKREEPVKPCSDEQFGRLQFRVTLLELLCGRASPKRRRA